MNSSFQSFYYGMKGFFYLTLAILVLKFTFSCCTPPNVITLGLRTADIIFKTTKDHSDDQKNNVETENPSNVRTFWQRTADMFFKSTKNHSDGENTNVETENLSGGKETNVESKVPPTVTLGDKK